MSETMNELNSELTVVRSVLISDAIKSWTNQLVDQGGRNTLLHFRDLKRGTLDLSSPPTSSIAIDKLLKGQKIRLSELFDDPEDLADAVRRARTLHANSKENEEERGLQTLHLASFMANWVSEQSNSTPNSPVLLQPLSIVPLGSRGDNFEVQIFDEPEINPVLLHRLNTEFGIDLDSDELLDINEEVQLDLREPAVISRLGEACDAVPGFTVNERLVIGNFSYMKLPMVRDLERSAEALEQHTLLAAMAGDSEALQELRENQVGAANSEVAPLPTPEDEFIVLDADSTQSYAIAAALAGANLVIIGPPGTGKSQTISNLVATLVARGRSVLFVAEKRAAIEAVVTRLEQKRLGNLVLDLHSGTRERRKTAESLGKAMSEVGRIQSTDFSPLHQRLTRRRTELESYERQLHQVSDTWGISAFETQSRLLGIPNSCQINSRFHGGTLEALTSSVISDNCEALQEFHDLGGNLLIMQGEHIWGSAYRNGAITDDNEVSNTLETLQELLQQTLPRIKAILYRECQSIGLTEPQTLESAKLLVDILEQVSQTFEVFQPDVFKTKFTDDIKSLAPASSWWFKKSYSSIFNKEYKRVLANTRKLSRIKLSDRALLKALKLAESALANWNSLGGQRSEPKTTDELDDLSTSISEAINTASKFSEKIAASTQIHRLEFDEAIAILSNLTQERAFLMRFPRVQRLEKQLRTLGLGPALEETSFGKMNGEDASQALEFAWLSSVLDRISVLQPQLSGFDADNHYRAVKEFTAADEEHIATSVERIMRAWAANVVKVLDENPITAQIVGRQATLKQKHLPMRDLFDSTSMVLTALKPCWVMSPLVVAQVLPPRQCFDTVIFDEASQILPADAIPTLLRGKQAIVAGDPYQLPPTTFFIAGVDDPLDDSVDDSAEDDPLLSSEAQDALDAGRSIALTRDHGSVLDVMRTLLPPPHGTKTLGWHYRSQDERLITFSNSRPSLYDWSLTTFPGARGEESIRHVLVPFQSESAGPTAFVSQEVDKVVELIIEHARRRPKESLGVVALGVRHADRISERLRVELSNYQEYEEFFGEEKAEPFFIKNLERVQGDERDSIILTVGYGKTTDGRMRYNFGPVNQDGGDRRLNVAITRARRSMTVVSSFSGREMDPDRLHGRGPQMLRDYLLYAESGGDNLGLVARAKPSLNPFERDVFEHLSSRGISLIPQFGQSGYWIDFAAMHPERKSEPVLAIETDGAQYHSSTAARDKDRLREQHLGRLGWKFHRIWSTDWFRFREREIERAFNEYEQAISSRDSQISNGGDEDAIPDKSAELTISAEPTEPLRRAWPGIRRSLSIGDYSINDLRSVVRWVQSDGLLRTQDQIESEVRKALGFKRRGSKIVEEIRKAINAERI